MTTGRCFGIAIGCAALLVNAPVSAKAADWMPLAVGTYWVYTAEGGVHQIETITGQRTLRGRTVAVKSYSEGVDTGLENYWLLDADGSVLLAGFLRADFGVAYEPPIRMLPVPPAVGPQPVQHISDYDIHTDAFLSSFDLGVEVLEDVVLTVPAGSFHAVGAGQVLPPAGPGLAAGRALTLDGRVLPRARSTPVAAQPTDWYSEGVGVVQYQTSALFQLSYSNLPTAAKLTSWARVKRLYR